MVTQSDMDVIAQITKDSKAKGQGGSTMGAPAAKGPADPNSVKNPLADAGVVAEPGGLGSTDLVGKPDTSKGLGSMDKLNMIAKMYQGGLA